MAVFRVERTRDYTVMSNHHLKNRELSLKAKGLLSMMLSLPDEWNYTTRGLAAICMEGVESIGNTLKELENAGYIVRNRLRDDKGRITDTEYVIYECPQVPRTDLPDTGNPCTGNPDMDKPDTDSPCTEKPAQLNTINNSIKNDKLPNVSNIRSNQFPSGNRKSERNGRETMAAYEQIIKENIDYDVLCQRLDKQRLDEFVALMVETVCTTRDTVCVAGNDFPAEVVKSKLLKLDSGHIEYIFDCLKENTSRIRNIKQYQLAVLFNAPTTIDSYYTARVNHDLYGGGGDG